VTRYGDGTAWGALAPGDVFHVPGGVPHALRNRTGRPATARRYGHWLATPAVNAAIGLRV